MSACTEIPPSTRLSYCRVVSAPSHACSYHAGQWAGCFLVGSVTRVLAGGQAEQSRGHSSPGSFHGDAGQGLFFIPS